MNFATILACFVVAFSVLSSTECRISFPQINSISTQSTTAATTKKLPEGRRQLPIFPKSLKKFTILPMFYYKTHSTQSLMSVITKKPLMRKLVLQEKRYDVNKIVETRTTRRPLMNRNFRFAKNFGVIRQTTPKKVINEQHFMAENIGSDVRNINESAKLKVNYNHGEIKEEITTKMYLVATENDNTQVGKYNVNASIETDTPNSSDLTSLVTTESTLENHNICIENCVTTSEETTKDSEINSQDFTIKINSASNNSSNEHIDLHQETKSNFELTENTTEKTYDIYTTTEFISKDITKTEIANSLSDIQTTESNTLNLVNDEYIQSTDSYTQSEIADQNEFIFLNEANKSETIERENIVSEHDEYTTEIFILPDVKRRRSINVIEEEISATTIPSLKLTDKDMKISDSVYFRNINL